MNNYKFRGKTKDEKWVYGNIFDDSFSDFIKSVLPETVGQWTGLLDKKGKEIYDGDILDQQGDKGKVIFEKGRFYVKWDDDFLTDYTFFKKITAVVEGNIYNNPKLLGDKK